MNYFFSLLLTLTSTCTFAGGWVQKSDFGGTARHRTTAVTIGNKVYFGLGHFNGAGPNVLFSDWWEYDPATNAWTQKADYLGGPCYHATGFTINNMAYVGTGRIGVNSNILVQDFFKYDVTINTWTQITSFPGSARRGAISFVIDGLGYVGTGETPSSRTSSFYRFDPSNETWIQVASLPGNSRTSSVGFSIGAYGYIGTGDASIGSINDFWQYDPTIDTWIQKPSIGAVGRLESTGFVLNGKGYILTGADFSSGNNFKDMWEYDPINETWTELDEFDGTARRYMSCVTLNGVAYCGLGTNGTNFKDFWLYDRTLDLLEENAQDVNLTIFPNPVIDIAHFSLQLPEGISENDFQAAVFSLSGQELARIQLTETKSVDLSSLPSGNYICALFYKEHPLQTHSLILAK